jgi:peptidoglycan hydrolase-like protein with peptidoglycan-binding domain
MERVMNKLTLTLLAGTALAISAAVPAMAQTTPQAQPQSPQNMAPMNQQQSSQPQSNQQATNQQISPRQIGRGAVRQVQQALNKDGFHAGRADGILGRNTRTALEDFQKSKNIQSSGQLNQQTLSQLGVNVASNMTPRRGSGKQHGTLMNSAPHNNNMNSAPNPKNNQ